MSTSGSVASGDGGTAGGSGATSAIGARLTGDVQAGTPSDISPPFPFESLVLAILYIVPMNIALGLRLSRAVGTVYCRGELLR
ncbi:hypothetical protein C8039_02495 [Halogeometricum sp. wsp3]|nr:hypothetical protein C8039_02495 [Halogeometricum sp. wsp3]